LRGDIETTIEASAKILPRDRGRQLHQALFADFLLQRLDECVGRLGRCPTERFGVVENRAFEFVESFARTVVSDLQELVFANALISADGRADIESEDASHECRDLDTRQGLERIRKATCPVKGESEPADGAK
jgi:hypothetical protein